MTTTATAPSGPVEPLYDNKRIRRDLLNCHTPRGYYKDDRQYIEVDQASGLSQMMRDTYEADRHRLHAENEQLRARVAELEADNSRITRYYLSYYNIMHSMAIATMDRVKQVERLTAELAEASGANQYLVSENSMLFDRAARRLAYIKQLEATLTELGWSDDDEAKGGYRMSDVRYEPIEDGIYWDAAHVAYIFVKGDWLRTGSDYDPGNDVKLNNKYRLCQRVEVEAAGVPSAEVREYLQWLCNQELDEMQEASKIMPAGYVNPKQRATCEAAIAWLASIAKEGVDADNT